VEFLGLLVKLQSTNCCTSSVLAWALGSWAREITKKSFGTDDDPGVAQPPMPEISILPQRGQAATKAQPRRYFRIMLENLWRISEPLASVGRGRAQAISFEHRGQPPVLITRPLSLLAQFSQPPPLKTAQLPPWTLSDLLQHASF
jgi:hypothetical protein